MPIDQNDSICPISKTHSSVRHDEPEEALGAPHLINWPWPVALMAHVPQQSVDASSSPDGSLLLVSPTAQGLDALESSGHDLSSLWVLAVDPDGPGALLGYRVEEITNWCSATPDGRQLSILRGPGGRVLAIENDDMFFLDSASSRWKGSGHYKQRSSASEE